MFATPFIICGMLQYISNIAQTLNDKSTFEFKSRSANENLEHCSPPEVGKAADCVTVGYSILGTPTEESQPKYNRIHKLMGKVAKSNDLDYGKDIKFLNNNTPKKVTDYFEAH